MTYDCLEQRMIDAYLSMLPPFVPDEKASVSAAGQEDFYSLIQNLFQLLFEDPLLLFPALTEDDSFPNRFNKSSYGKPALQTNMRKLLKTADALLKNMFLLGQGADVKLSGKQTALLSKLGIADLAKLPDAWVWMASRPGANLSAFTYCLFSVEYPYTSDIYARLLGEEAFRRLESELAERGYERHDFYNVTASDCRLSLTYANPAWGNGRPNGGFEFKIKHTGISARYDPMIREPAVLGLCIPNGLKPYLNAFDSMPESCGDFVVKHAKKCDSCGYCVQTDKTGTRPLAAVAVRHGGNENSLCPYFPGCSFNWTHIDGELIHRILEMLTFMDGFARQAR